MLKTILKFSVSNIVNLILGVVSAVVLTRTFDPDVYGLLNIFNATVAVGLSLLYIGLDSSYIRFYNEPPGNDTNKELGTKLLCICLLTTVVVGFVISTFLYKRFTIFIFGFESRIICIMLFISIFAQVILRFLNIKYRMDFNTRAFTVQAVLTQVSLKLFVIIAAVFSLSISGVISFNTLGVLLLSVAYLFIQKKSFFSFENLGVFESYKPVFVFAFFSAPLVICINLNTSMTQQIISHTLGVSQVGIYASAGYFASILAALQGGFSTFWSAYMYSHYKDRQEEIKKVNEYLLLIIIMTFGTLILFKDVVYLLIGEQYQESKHFFSLTLSYPVLMLAAETTTYGIGIKKKTHLSLACFLISIVINLGLAYLLAPRLGLKGAALASLVSGVVLYILRTYIGQKLYQSISSLKITIVDIVFIIIMALLPAFTSTYIATTGVIIVVIITLIINREKTMIIIHKCHHLVSEVLHK